MKINNDSDKKQKPFIKWAGGKQQLIGQLLSLLPKDILAKRYHEPFLGGGALFFSLQPKISYLSDANDHLVNCFQFVRENPELIYSYLKKHEALNSETYYYKMRQTYNKMGYSFAQAARFIYLNKSCYNGIFRVNRKGKFNVPCGRKKTLAIPDRGALKRCSKILQTAKIFTASFESALEDVDSNDFIYLDPPYPPLNGTSYFTHYTKDKFGDLDQEKVASIVKSLDSEGCLFMVSNADTKKIRKLYKNFHVTSLSVTRFITCKKTRHRVKELIITNY